MRSSKTLFLQTILTVALFAIIAFLSTHKIINYDIWFELKSGEQIVENASLQFKEQFAYTALDRPYVNHVWLSEVVFHYINVLGGINGLIVFKVLLVLVLFGFLFHWLINQNGEFYTTFLLIITAYLLCRFRLIIRPHLFTFLFMMLTYYCLDQFKKDKRKSLFILIPLLILWTNLHFGSLFGIVLIGIYLFGFLLEGNILTSKGKHLLVIFFLSLVAVMVNPGTYHFYTIPLIGASYGSKYGITETVSPINAPSTLIAYPLFWLTLFGCFYLLIKKRKEIDITDTLLLLFAFVAGLSMIRFIPLFALIATPVVARLRPQVVPKGLGAAFSIIVCLMLVFILPKSHIGLLKRYTLGFGVNEQYLPKTAAQFLIDHDIKGNIFNDMGYGGYFIFTRYPHNRVFIYGRYNATEERAFQQYFQILSSQGNWQGLLDQYSVDIICLDKTLALRAPLMLSLSQSAQWKLVLDDEKSVLFLRDIPVFKPIIEKYEYEWELVPI